MRKIFEVIRNLFSIIGLLSVLGLAAFFLFLNKPFFGDATSEFARISSPNKEYEIVITKYEPTSFTTPVYSLFIVPYGEKYSPKSDYYEFDNFRSISLLTEDVRWEDDSTIIIKRSSRSNVYNFEPEYYDPRYCTPKHKVEEYKKIEIELENY